MLAPRRILPAVVALAVLALGATIAQGDPVPFAPCPGKVGVECATVPVPLDRSGNVPGEIDLHVERIPARVPASGTLVALVGGPGQAGSAFTRDLATDLAPALANQDLVVVDQRGTGQSGFLRCPAIDAASIGDPVEAVARCADEIGPQRAFFTTREAAEDVESVRQALGLDKLSLFGVSYGTKLAVAYALGHPDRVERLVLDSVDLPDQDPFRRPSLAAIPRVLRSLCAHGACRGITRDPYRDLVRLVRRIEEHVVQGKLIGPDGRSHLARLRQGDLLSLLFVGDFRPDLRLAVPAAVRSALSGDVQPLLRLELLAANAGPGVSQSSAFSSALFLATTCEETAFPWDRSAPADTRLGAAQGALSAIPAAALAPFSRTTVLASSSAVLCLGWPAAPTAPDLGPGPLPDVPVLELEGAEDLRTPLEDARQLASQFPQATVLRVPRAGHSVVSSDGSGCVGRALQAFFRDRPLVPCATTRLRGASRPLPVAPTALRRVPPALGGRLGLGGRRGRTVTAVRLTIVDALRTQLIAGPTVFGGLRGGAIAVVPGGLRLTRVVYVPGVVVSGVLKASGGPSAGRFAVEGRAAARGTVEVFTDRTARGVLDGRPFRARFRSQRL